MQLYDARGNEFRGAVDTFGADVLTETRTAAANLGVLSAEVVTPINGHATVSVDIRGTFVATLKFQTSIDGTNYTDCAAFAIATELYVINTTVPGQFKIEATGQRFVKVTVSAYTSGSAAVACRATLADEIVYAKPIPATLVQSGTAAANTGVTLTLPAAGAGLYHYIVSLEMTRNATAALAGTATLVITTTNLSGSLAWSVGNAMIAGGTQIDVARDFAVPLKSSVANTATTIVMPAPGAAVLWRGNCYYYVGA